MTKSNDSKKKYFSKKILELESGEMSDDDIVQLFQDLVDHDLYYLFGEEILQQTKALIKENIIHEKKVLH